MHEIYDLDCLGKIYWYLVGLQSILLESVNIFVVSLIDNIWFKVKFGKFTEDDGQDFRKKKKKKCLEWLDWRKSRLFSSMAKDVQLEK